MPHENDPGTLRTIAQELAGKANEHFFRLGDTLAVISSARYYKEWGFSTWKDYVEKEIHLNVSASYELLSIVRWSQVEGLSLAERRSLSEVGRTKAYCIAHLATRESLKKWLQVAKKATCEDMRNRMYDEPPTDAPKTVSFWLYGDERKAIEHALNTVAKNYDDDVRMGVLLTEVCKQHNMATLKKAKRKKATPKKKATTKKKTSKPKKKAKKTAA